MSQNDMSIIELLCNGNDSVCMSVGDMVQSLKDHHVSMEEAKSMENEITSTPQFPNPSFVLTVFTLFVTCYSGLLLSQCSELLSGLSIKTSKLEKKAFENYWKTHGNKVISKINEYSGDAIFLAFIVLIILVIVITIFIWALRPYLLKKARLQALYEYERFLIRRKNGEMFYQLNDLK